MSFLQLKVYEHPSGDDVHDRAVIGKNADVLFAKYKAPRNTLPLISSPSPENDNAGSNVSGLPFRSTISDVGVWPAAVLEAVVNGVVADCCCMYVYKPAPTPANTTSTTTMMASVVLVIAFVLIFIEIFQPM